MIDQTNTLRASRFVDTCLHYDNLFAAAKAFCRAPVEFSIDSNFVDRVDKRVFLSFSKTRSSADDTRGPVETYEHWLTESGNRSGRVLSVSSRIGERTKVAKNSDAHVTISGPIDPTRFDGVYTVYHHNILQWLNTLKGFIPRSNLKCK